MKERTPHRMYARSLDSLDGLYTAWNIYYWVYIIRVIAVHFLFNLVILNLFFILVLRFFFAKYFTIPILIKIHVYLYEVCRNCLIILCRVVLRVNTNKFYEREPEVSFSVCCLAVKMYSLKTIFTTDVEFRKCVNDGDTILGKPH